MRHFKLLSRGFMFLAAAFIFISCSLTSPPKPELPPLQVVYEAWPGYLPIVIAQEQGFFAQQGVKVEAILTEAVQAKIPDFSAGKYDGIAIALGDALNASLTNPDLNVIVAVDRSDGADAVIADSQIKTVRDLKGKALGTRLGGFGELFISKMLEINNLTANEVTLTNTVPEQVESLIKSGKIQAGHTWQPHVSVAQKSGLRVLFTSKETPGLIPDVMIFQGSVVRQRPDDLRRFVRAWFQAVDYWKTNPESGNAIIAKFLNVKPETISLSGVKLLTLRDNLKAFTPNNNMESLHYTTQVYADFFARTGSLTHPPDINKLLNSSFLQ